MDFHIYNSIVELPLSSEALKNIPVFATSEYAEFLFVTKSFKTIWILGSINGRPEFFIPFAVAKRIVFKKGMFMTSLVFINESVVNENEKEILNCLINFIKIHKISDWIQQSPNWALFNIYPDYSVFIPFGSYIIDLEKHSLEQLFEDLAKKKRQYIRKGLKDGIEIKDGKDYFQEVYRLIKNTALKGGLSYLSYSAFQKMYSKLDGYIYSYIAFYKGIPQSVLITVSNSYCQYTQYAGTITKPVRGASELLYWEAIKAAKLRNVRFFDFVGARLDPELGSKQYQIQSFKSDFGADLKKGYLWKLSFSPAKFFIYDFTRKIIALLKNKKISYDIIDQEIKRSRK